MQLTKNIIPVTQEETTKSIRKLSPAAYLLISLPLGILYFTFVVAGISLSAALSPIFIGIPLLLVVFIGLSGMMRFERSLALAVLGE